MKVNYEIRGRVGHDAHIASRAVADAMEQLKVGHATDAAIKMAAEQLAVSTGDEAWDVPSVFALIEWTTFSLMELE